MKLYVGVLSLFSAKARIALHEKGVEPELVYVGWSREDRYLPHHPDVVALNPRAQVPVLVDGDVVVYDSTQIFEYLEERIPEPALYPRDIAGRVRCRRLEAEADESWFPHVWDLIEQGFYADGSGTRTRADAARDALHGLYESLEKELSGRAFLTGSFGVADIATFIQVNAAGVLGAPVPEGCVAVAGWCERIAARGSVNPVLREMMQAAAGARVSN
jgi:glutathione S-transferase